VGEAAPPLRPLPDKATDQTDWVSPQGNYVLPPAEVHVWRITLGRHRTQLPEMEAILSADERQKADRFFMPADRDRCVLGRGALRLILARCVATTADQLRFEYNGFGKPHLAGGSGEPALQFNLSHSGEFILIAVTIGRAIGVDVEWMRPLSEVAEISERFFSARERSMLASLPAEQQHSAFFTCWTRKEAFIKAVGNGLSHPLDQFDVSLLPGETPRLMETRPDPAEAGRWEMRELNVGDDYAAAVVVEGAGWNLKAFDWPER
jgi:4'-phosphopantetheinyl transferase